MNRTRRLRVTETMRSLVRETRLSKSDFVYPIFVIEGTNLKNPVESMPGIFQYSMDRLPEEIERIRKSGVTAVLIFGIPDHKDEVGSGAYEENGVTQRAVRQIKKDASELLVIADVCLCEYTSHGHCGIVEKGCILNDETLPLLSKMAVSLARAGADMIAPSDMMDGRVGAIRKSLDEAGFVNLPIMAYSAKYSSAYYAPFRDAAHSAPGFGDRKTYQMDYANRQEALREVENDLEEGADIVMVKPALAYLDVIREVSDKYPVPVAAYNVSGEYSLVKAAARNGWIEEKKIVLENLTAIKRAGADIIITYHALDAALWLMEEQEKSTAGESIGGKTG